MEVVRSRNGVQMRSCKGELGRGIREGKRFADCARGVEYRNGISGDFGWRT
jgi:hypothetical protein